MLVVSKVTVLKDIDNSFKDKNGKPVDYRLYRVLSDDGEVYDVPYDVKTLAGIEQGSIGVAKFDLVTKSDFKTGKAKLALKFVAFDSE